jgi:hypothetical protein
MRRSAEQQVTRSDVKEAFQSDQPLSAAFALSMHAIVSLIVPRGIRQGTEFWTAGQVCSQRLSDSANKSC